MPALSTLMCATGLGLGAQTAALGDQLLGWSAIVVAGTGLFTALYSAYRTERSYRDGRRNGK